MKKFGKLCVVSLAILIASLCVAQPAMAVRWKSWTDPLIGYADGHAFGGTYGYFDNNSVSAVSETWQSDMRPGGRKVRVETDFYFYEAGTGCASPCWLLEVSKQTDETSTESWIQGIRARNLHGGATAARGGINICEIRPFQNDPCSPHAWVSFSY